MSSEDIMSQAPPPADARISYGSDPLQFFDLRLPNVNQGHSERREPQASAVEGSAFPLAILIHGGFWRARYDLTHAGHLCAALTKAGFATANVEYRRVGNPGGGWPGSLQDVEAALRSVTDTAKNKALDLRRLVVIGHSAGGQLALVLASRHPELRGVVALAPVSDLRSAYDRHLSNDAVVEFLGGVPSGMPAKYAEASPVDLKISVPQIIIHGTHDETVPIEMSRSYAERKRRHDESVRLLELDCGHFELIDPSSAAWGTVRQAALALTRLQ